MNLPIRHAQIAAGPDAPVADWYAAYYRQVYAVCLRVLADVVDAEEATQDAFVEAWRAWPRFRAESELGTWLHTIAARTALRRLRDRRRRSAHFVRAGGDADVIPLRQVMHAERMDLEAAIAALPERARAVLVLHEIHGYRLAEVAEWMGTSVGTAKSQLHRARQLLKETLDR